MDNRVINHCKGGETYNPKTNGEKSCFRQEWFKCGMGWFTWNENFSLSAFGTSDGNCFGLPHALVIHCGGNDIAMGFIRDVLKHLIMQL